MKGSLLNASAAIVVSLVAALALNADGPNAHAYQVPSTVDLFVAGYRAGGGLEALLPTALSMVDCETGGKWDPDLPGYYFGLAQFDPASWAAAARPGADYRDPFEQGFAVARWSRMIDPASSAGWRHCWRN